MAHPLPDPKALVNFMTLVGTELAIGFVIGLAVWLLFTAVQIAGQIISQTSGMSLADVFSSSIGSSTPLLAQGLYWVALAVFLTIGGHRLVMQGLLESFDSAPLGASVLSPAISEMIIDVVAMSFELALRIAAPAFTALLLSTLVMGLISRTLPQLNILVVGFGVNAMVTFAVLAFSLGGAAWAFQEQIEPVVQSALEAVRAPLVAKPSP